MSKQTSLLNLHFGSVSFQAETELPLMKWLPSISVQASVINPSFCTEKLHDLLFAWQQGSDRQRARQRATRTPTTPTPTSRCPFCSSCCSTLRRSLIIWETGRSAWTSGLPPASTRLTRPSDTSRSDCVLATPDSTAFSTACHASTILLISKTTMMVILSTTMTWRFLSTDDVGIDGSGMRWQCASRKCFKYWWRWHRRVGNALTVCQQKVL